MPDPMSIAEEFLSSGDTQAQKNALTFLRVIGEPESIRRLVHAAVENPSADVRERAFRELQELEGDGRSLAAAVLNEILVSDRSDEAARAYFLLGELNQTVSVRSLLARMRYANATHDLIYPAKTVSFYRRHWWASLVGAAGAAFGLLLYLSVLTSLPSEVTTLVLISALLLSVPVGTLASYRATPIHRYAETVPALVIECLWAVSGVFVLGLVGVALSYVLQIGVAPEMLDLVVALTVTTALIRLVSIFSFATAPSDWSTLLQVLAGGCAGTIALTAFALVDRGGLTSDYWPTLIALAFGVSGAFALADREGAGEVEVSAGARWVAGTVIASFLVLTMWTGVFGGVADTRSVELDQNITRLPTALAFSLPRPETVAFGIREDTDVMVYLRDSAGTEMESWDYPAAFERALAAGIYTIEIVPYGDEPSGVVARSQSIVFPRLTGAPVVLETPGGAADVEGDGLPMRLRTVRRAERTIEPLAEDLPAITSLAEEITETPFIRDFRVDEPQSVELRLDDELGYREPSFTIRLVGRDGTPVLDRPYGGVQAAQLAAGDYRIIVDRTETFRTNFPDAKLVETARSLGVRTILPGLSFRMDPVELITYREGTDPITPVSEDSGDARIPVNEVPSAHFIQVTGDAPLGLRIELDPGPVYSDYVLYLYDESGQSVAVADDPESIAVDLSPGVYTLLVEYYPSSGSFTRSQLRNTSPVSGVVLSVEPLYRPGLDELTLVSPGMSARTIPVSEVPFVHFISVSDGLVDVDISLDQDEARINTDYVLTLYDRTGQRDQRDDPEELNTTLFAGQYWVAIERYPAAGAAERLEDGRASGPFEPVPPGVVLRIQESP